MNRKIAVVESSNIMAKIITDAFASKNYQVINLYDGLDALNYLLKNPVGCVVSNNVLSSIDGYQLNYVLREGNKYAHVPVILYTTEEDDGYDFKANLTKTELVKLSVDGLDEFIDIVGRRIVETENVNFFIDDENNYDIKKLDSAVCAVNALENNLIKLMVYNKVGELSKYIGNLYELSEGILKSIYDFCPYDAVAMILNTSSVKIYYSIDKQIDEQNQLNFLKISKSDFEGRQGISSSTEYDEVCFDFFNGSSSESSSAEFKSIKTYSIEYNGFIGTLHLASRKRKFFTYTLKSALELYTKLIGVMIYDAVKFTEMSVQNQRLYDAFTKFVPEEVIEDMIKNDGSKNQSDTEKRKVAILICDIRSFTTLSEINQPEDVVNFLNGYFTRMVDIIKQKGGSIDKFMGDAIMANFGAPISYSDNAGRAVDAAVAMIEALSDVPKDMLKFNEKVKTIDIGIGIHYGEVIVGNIGCKDKTDYTVIGDSANLASRLEGLTKQYGANIIVSRDVIDGIEEAVKKDGAGNELKEVDRKALVTKLIGQYNLVQLDKVKVKGKNKGIDIFSVNPLCYSEEYKTNYEKGLSLYLKGNFGFAREYFEKALDKAPGDKACKLLLSICQQYKINPPPEWDGARELTSK